MKYELERVNRIFDKFYKINDYCYSAKIIQHDTTYMCL